MKPTFKTARLSMFALPLVVAGGMATAGGLADPVVTPAPAPVAAPVVIASGSDWTGFYAGAQLGYGQLDSDTLDTLDVEVDGATFGAHVGYLADFGSWVLGGELQLDGTNIESSDDAVLNAEIDTVTRGLLRLGYDGGDFLPYITGGIAQARVSGDDPAGAPLDGDDTGSVFGLGAEYRVSPTIRVGAEVLRHQFDDFNDSGIDLEATTAAARVSFQF